MSSIFIQSTKASVNKRLLASLFATSTFIAGTAYYFNQPSQKPTPQSNKNGKYLITSTAPLISYIANKKDEHSKDEYQKVYNSIAQLIEDYDSYDEGIGLGPVLVRLAWHQSGTYTRPDLNTDAPSHSCPAANHLKNSDGSLGVGGSFGGTMRHSQEAGDGANAGLQNARYILEKVHKQFPWISYGDLYTLGGVTAIQEMGGPKIGWRSGREDLDETYQQINKLPDASKGADYVRHLFARMGFNDREVVSLIGAHCLGSCHVNAPPFPTLDDDDEGESSGPGSGYTGRWTASPNMFTNEFFKLLLSEKWEFKKWDGPQQYVNKDDLMMLPADMALIQDPKYKKIVETYAKDQDQYFKDFAKDFQKLLELGITFNKDSWYFKTLEEQS